MNRRATKARDARRFHGMRMRLAGRRLDASAARILAQLDALAAVCVAHHRFATEAAGATVAARNLATALETDPCA